MIEKANALDSSKLTPNAIFNYLINLDEKMPDIDLNAGKKSTRVIFSETGREICKVSTLPNGQIRLNINNNYEAKNLQNIINQIEILAEAIADM